MSGNLPVIRLGRIILASLMAMLLFAVLIQQSTIHLFMEAPGEFALTIPGMVVLMGLVLLSAVWARVAKGPLLTRPEMICVAYTMLIASPLMTQGFWHRLVSITATIPRGGDFEKIDALGDRLWPHGPNVLAEGFSPDSPSVSGAFAWEEMEVTPGVIAPVAVLANSSAGDVSQVRIRVPVEAGKNVVPGQPYLVSVLARPTDLAGDAFYFGRIYADESERFTELFFSRSPSRITSLHPLGFGRIGLYGVPAPALAKDSVVVEFGLNGRGRVEFHDPKMMNVHAMETVFTGLLEVTESEYAELTPAERVGLLVRPDNIWSLRGLMYYFTGFVPWRDWLSPVATWAAVVLLLLTGTLCLNVIFRKKWLETERYELPLTRIPLSLIGGDGESIWRNRVFWIGFGLSAFWCLMKGWHFYNPAVPDMNIRVPLAPYFGEGWGGMWNGVEFRVLAVLVAVAVFIELNILLSIVAGYFLFRLLYWVGAISAANVYPGYPFAQEQQIAAFLAYALLTVIFSWKYLLAVGRAVIRPSKEEKRDGEVMSYRSAVFLLLGILGGSLAWASWVGVSLEGMFCFMIFLILVGFVSSKFRAEAGLPYGYFTPNNSALILLLLGGLSTFGPEMLLVAFISSFFMSVAAFFLIPGAQLELMELGRRNHMKSRHVLTTIYLGLIGGIVIGGWVFLSNAYSLGGDSLTYTWGFLEKPWYFNNFDLLLSRATAEMTSAEELASATDPSIWAYAYGAAGTGVLVVLRQLFAGFWFHPVGFVLGSTHMMGMVWGSFLMAWALRLVVVKFGGAEAVKTKLQPFFVGVFAAAVLAMFWFGIYGSILNARGVQQIFGEAL